MADKTAEKTEAHTPHPARPHVAEAPKFETADGPGLAPAAIPVPKREPAKPVHERYFKLREQSQTCYHAILFANVMPEDVVTRNFWSEIPHKVKSGDKIVVISENSSWYGEMLVWGVGINWVEARFLPGFPMISPVGVGNQSIGTDYLIEDRGLIKKWTVIRKEDGREIWQGGSTMQAASQWLAEYVRMQASSPRAA